MEKAPNLKMQYVPLKMTNLMAMLLSAEGFSWPKYERERERASDSDYSDSFKEIPKTPVEMIEAG